MLYYLGFTHEYYFIKTAADVIYYSLIGIAIVLALFLAYKRLISLGYDKNKTIVFMLLCAVVIFPAAYMGTRAAAMFYKPISKWSIDLFFEIICTGTAHTFHAGLILSAIGILILIPMMRFKYPETFDTFCLYIPLGHAIGRLACLIVGCCWGRFVTFKLLWINVKFPNPVPLYAIIANILIFLLLRRLYENIYSDQNTRKQYGGLVSASYFILYGTIRIILEIFRKERIIAYGLSQAQIAMIIFVITGLAICLVVWIRNQKNKTEAKTPIAENIELRKLLLLGGFLASYLALFFFVFYLIKKAHVLPWPFQNVKTIAGAYAGIIYYIPFTAIPALSLFWLEKSGVPALDKFRWSRFSKYFPVGLAFSFFYTIYLLVLKEPNLRGPAFWPPVVILSVMNAFSEEIVYRFAAYEIFTRANYPRVISNIAQATLYSLIHFIMGGPVLGGFSFIYGIILGAVMIHNDSITPCIVCHFIIDIGCIGLPMLSY